MKSIKFISIVMAFMFFYFLSHAQSNDKYKIEYVLDKSESFVERIDFIDKNSSQVINSFDVVERNPYNSLGDEYIRLNEYHCKVYEYEKLKQSFGLDYFLPTDSRFLGNDAPKKIIIKSIESFPGVFTKGEKNTVITYELLSYNIAGEIIGIKSSIYILDNKGETYRKYEHIDSDCRSAQISPDGKLFYFLYGGPIDHNFNEIKKEGLKVIDIGNNEVIVKYQPENGLMNKPFFKHGKLFIVTKLPNYEYEYRVYDFHKQIVLIRIFSKKERGSFVNIEEDGILAKDESGKITKFLFETNFKKEKL